MSTSTPYSTSAPPDPIYLVSEPASAPPYPIYYSVEYSGVSSDYSHAPPSGFNSGISYDYSSGPSTSVSSEYPSTLPSQPVLSPHTLSSHPVPDSLLSQSPTAPEATLTPRLRRKLQRRQRQTTLQEQYHHQEGTQPSQSHQLQQHPPHPGITRSFSVPISVPTMSSMSSSRRPTVTPVGNGAGGSHDDADNWAMIRDPAERRRVQNRIAQRNYRDRRRVQAEEEARIAAHARAAGAAYMAPDPAMLARNDNPEGLPWGSYSVRHAVEAGTARAAADLERERERSQSIAASRRHSPVPPSMSAHPPPPGSPLLMTPTTAAMAAMTTGYSVSGAPAISGVPSAAHEYGQEYERKIRSASMGASAGGGGSSSSKSGGKSGSHSDNGKDSEYPSRSSSLQVPRQTHGGRR